MSEHIYDELKFMRVCKYRSPHKYEYIFIKDCCSPKKVIKNEFYCSYFKEDIECTMDCKCWKCPNRTSR